MTFCFGHWLSAQATSDPTWQSDVAKLRPIEKVTDKIQPSPIRCFTWAKPNNLAYLSFFLSIFGQVHGPSPTIQPFYFLGHGLFGSTISDFLIITFFFSCFKMGQLVRWVPL